MTFTRDGLKHDSTAVTMIFGFASNFSLGKYFLWAPWVADHGSCCKQALASKASQSNVRGRYNVGPPNVTSWFINPSKYGNKYHKPLWNCSCTATERYRQRGPHISYTVGVPGDTPRWYWPREIPLDDIWTHQNILQSVFIKQNPCFWRTKS